MTIELPIHTNVPCYRDYKMIEEHKLMSSKDLNSSLTFNKNKLVLIESGEGHTPIDLYEWQGLQFENENPSQLDQQTQDLLEQLNKLNYPPLEESLIEELRHAVIETPKLVLPQIKKIENIEIPGPHGPINCRLYFPYAEESLESLPVFVFFHGGGWVLGNLDENDYVCQNICYQTPCIVVSVDYHLAPEYKFPKPLTDCYVATKWVSDHIHQFGGDNKRLAIGGDSAGGNLAAAVALMARDRLTPKINYQVLIFPALNNQFDTLSYLQFGEGYYLTRQSMQFFWNMYLGRPEDGLLPYASPLKATTLSNLPATLMVLANFDPLRDDGLAYALRLYKDHVPVELKRYNTIHAFINFEKELDVADEALQDIAKSLRQNLAP